MTGDVGFCRLLLLCFRQGKQLVDLAHPLAPKLFNGWLALHDVDFPVPRIVNCEEAYQARLALTLLRAYQYRHIVKLYTGVVQTVDAPGEDQAGHLTAVGGIVNLCPGSEEVFAPILPVPCDVIHDVDYWVVPPLFEQQPERSHMLVFGINPVIVFDIAQAPCFCGIAPRLYARLRTFDFVYLRILEQLVVADT